MPSRVVAVVIIMSATCDLAAGVRPSIGAFSGVRTTTRRTRSAAPELHTALHAAAPSKAVAAAAATAPPVIGLSAGTLIQTIFKAIVGIGVFSLSIHIVRGPGLVMAGLIATLVGALSAWTFYIVGRAAGDSGADDNKSLWAATVGPRTAWVYDVSCGAHAFGGMVQFYSTMVILVRWVAAWLAEVAGAKHAAVHGALSGMSHGRALNIVSVCMLPLLLARELSALAMASVVGLLGVLYAVVLLIWRTLDGSYRNPAGAFAATATGPVGNIFGVRGLAPVAIFIGSVNTAYFVHFGIPRYYAELAAPADARGAVAGASKLATFRRVVAMSFLASGVVTVGVMLLGYLLFGDACESLLLNNFSVHDQGAALLRVATLLSVAMLAAFSFLALRDATAPHVLRTGTTDGADDRLRETGLRLVLAALVHAAAFFARDVGFIIALRGALLGSLVCFTMPAMIFLHSERGRTAGRTSRALHKALAAYGVTMAALSTACVLKA